MRHVFMDLLVLADLEGNVDMTAEAIARRTNVPLEVVLKSIKKLSQPDPHSRTKSEEGRRIVPLDETRNWGWRIVNYDEYRRIRDEEARRAYFREHKRKMRAKATESSSSPHLSTPVLDSPKMSTHTEAHTPTKANAKKDLVGSADAQPTAAPQEPPLTLFPCKGTGKKEWPLYRAKVAEWKQAYPGVDVPMELRQAKQWLMDNPARGKTYNGMAAFLGRWLSKAQNHTGGHANGTRDKGEQRTSDLKQKLRNVAARLEAAD